ncbi:ABC transporter permease subunit [Dermabacter hominis]|uniref:ABC transporter permease subunit n=1 Tax=Dermabacter hominis TaxID=36740 RepID=UPI0021B0346D|nr:ABC transporter permease subunit [Dermabacter hominis]MCT2024458.1 ABC transporter permease subunit [Dermabacter hominis]
MTATDAPAFKERSTSLLPLILKIVFLGAVLATACWLVPVLIGLKLWMWLAITIVVTIAIFCIYSTKRFIPAKYIFPGTFFLLIFLITPILLTVNYSFTNYGDGTRGTKEQAIASITGNSVKEVEGSTRFNASVATTGTAADGPFELYLVNPETGEIFHGSTEQPLEKVDPADVKVENKRVVEAGKGVQILTNKEINQAGKKVLEIAVEKSDTEAIRLLTPTMAFEGTKVMRYDEASDTITNSETGEIWSIKKVGSSEKFVSDKTGQALSQGWLQGVGLDNYARLFTNGKIGAQFFKVFLWTLAFAFLSVATTFILGLFLALVLNDDRLKGKRLYRSFLLLPYAVPGFISLLIWSNFYNKDFGLINNLLHLDINWLGDPTMAKVAVLLTNLWMGFPYMFIICTGALQSIPEDIKEAARIDGASRFQTTVRVIAPLLLVAVAPLLVSSFAFNFNNFNAIQLLTGGGPFGQGEYTAGGTDILISMIYRIAFGGSGADFGFASAVSVALFFITGLLAALQFRATRVLEDFN